MSGVKCIVRNVYRCIEPDAFLNWLSASPPGSKITYSTISVSAEDNSTNIRTMDEARESYLRGEVHLVQQRTGTGRFNCVAIMRQNISPPGDCWIGIAK